jgi:hypothetical protein
VLGDTDATHLRRSAGGWTLSGDANKEASILSASPRLPLKIEEQV